MADNNLNNTENQASQDINQLLKVRREKLAALQAAGKDPFVITKYKGLDPEISGEGIDKELYPRPRSFMLGVNLNL